MSGEEESDAMMCCAACGTAQVDDTKLKKCTACYLVRYCSVKCQKEHRPKHKRACKKRAAELYGEILFKQPESSHLGDCPICCLPLPVDGEKSTLMECCSKVICLGCDVANQRREIKESLENICPFCRKAAPTTDEEADMNLMKRVKANDPIALRQIGQLRYNEGGYDASFQYWTKAARLGDVGAHYALACMYREGQGVQKDVKKKVHHLEQAAIGGHPDARYKLGVTEKENDRVDRAVKHWIIATNMGHVCKEDLAAALRAHQAAVDATTSPQRQEAEVLMKKFEAEKAAG
eukprot:scaffold1220_cov104-Skeletonema_dohrnii-CCMP3373.AAC.9